jgi:hypothetical protein
MTRTLHIHITAGATTCASNPGHFCALLATTYWGQRHYCRVFRPDDDMLEADGWLLRWPECIEAEEGQP